MQSGGEPVSIQHLWQCLGRVAVLGILITSASACGSGNLTREKAEELIRAKGKLPQTDHMIEMYPACERVCDGHAENSVPHCGPDALSASSKLLLGEGLFTIAYDGNTSRMTITSKGKQYAKGEPFRSYYGLCATQQVWASMLEFGAVTGIAEGADSKSATVEYTLERKPTPFGTILGRLANVNVGPETVPQKASFRKYDDGWRIE
jgi:hypothetical protein